MSHFRKYESCMNIDFCREYADDPDDLGCEDCHNFMEDIDSIMARFEEVYR